MAEEEDRNPNCGLWAKNGLCKKNAKFMNIYCRKSCIATGDLVPGERNSTRVLLGLRAVDSPSGDTPSFLEVPVFALRAFLRMKTILKKTIRQ